MGDVNTHAVAHDQPRASSSCGEHCPYRRLYDGSQRSLGDLASKHTAAVQAHAHLREELLATMRRAWPHAARAAEQNTGARLGDLPDEFLTAYLAAFAGLPSSGRRTGPQQVEQLLSGLLELRQQLERMGVELPEQDDPSAWAAALRDAQSGAGPHADTRPRRVVGEVGGLFSAAPVDEPAPAPPPDEAPPPRPRADLSGLFDDGEPDAPAPPGASDAATQQATHATSEPPAQPPGPSRSSSPPDQVGPPLQPELLRPAGGRRARKSPRVSAVRSQPAAPPAEVDADDLDEAADQLARQARPVFTSDLSRAGASAQRVAEWEQRVRDAYPQSPFRLVGGRNRHRDRGSLLYPASVLEEDGGPLSGTLWGEALVRYRGAQLYELGVLLHRVGDDVVSHSLGDEVAVLRLADRGQVTGLLVVLGGKLGPGGKAREALADPLADLVSERLSLVGVLATRDRQLDALVDAAACVVAERGVDPPMPLVAAYSWEWSDAAGTAARSVLPTE